MANHACNLRAENLFEIIEEEHNPLIDINIKWLVFDLQIASELLFK